MSLEDYAERTDLSGETRTLVRMMLALIEEVETIGTYEARLSLEENSIARAVILEAQLDEVRHLGMTLEFVLRAKPQWRARLKSMLFSDGRIAGAEAGPPPDLP